MKKLAIILAALAMAGIASANLINDVTYSNLSGSSAVGGTGDWFGYAGADQVPSFFVTAATGVATVSVIDGTEWNLYQQFEGTLAAGDYTWSVDASNITVNNGATLFVKKFDSGFGWIGWDNQPLAAGPNSMTFTAAAGNIYQVGTLTSGATSGAYSLTNPDLVPEPATMGLFAIFGGALWFMRRSAVRNRKNT